MKEKENTCSLHKSHNIDTSIDSNKLLSYQVQFNCKFPFNKASTIIIVHVNDDTSSVNSTTNTSKEMKQTSMPDVLY